MIVFKLLPVVDFKVQTRKMNFNMYCFMLPGMGIHCSFLFFYEKSNPPKLLLCVRTLHPEFTHTDKGRFSVLVPAK